MSYRIEESEDWQGWLVRGEPWIEFGVGWAKVHYGRELTDEDRERLLAAVRQSPITPAT